MAITAKKISHLGRTVAVTWQDGGADRSVALTVGDDNEIKSILGADTVILDADPPAVRKSLIQQVSAEDFRTTNATQATMVSWPLAPQTLYAARFTLLAIDTVNADCRAWTAKATAKRVNGAALLVGTPEIETSHADAGAAAWSVTADVTGNNFRVRVTGAAGRTISWSLVGEIVRGRPDGLVD